MKSIRYFLVTFSATGAETGKVIFFNKVTMEEPADAFISLLNCELVMDGQVHKHLRYINASEITKKQFEKLIDLL